MLIIRLKSQSDEIHLLFAVSPYSYNNGVFGRQLIRAQQKRLNDWTQTEIDIGFSQSVKAYRAPIASSELYPLARFISISTLSVV